MTIKTPSGITVEVKDKPTFGDRKAVKKVIQNSLTMNVDSKTANDVGMGFLLEAQEVFYSRIILSITFPDGKKVTDNIIQTIDDMDEADGQYIFDELEKNFKILTGDDEKKGA